MVMEDLRMLFNSGNGLMHCVVAALVSWGILDAPDESEVDSEVESGMGWC